MKRMLAAILVASLSLAGCSDDDDPAPTPCEAFCGRVAQAACVNDDPSTCVPECTAASAQVGACVDEFNAYLLCGSGAPFECDVDGYAAPTASCDTEELALLTCLFGPVKPTN